MLRAPFPLPLLESANSIADTHSHKTAHTESGKRYHTHALTITLSRVHHEKQQPQLQQQAKDPHFSREKAKHTLLDDQ